ncbi:MAG TPA: hypothetical protein VHQ47_03660 [Phycisphaerae bacterium]|nr:hypothetical protein [Phycisphaerae bacterium]
MLLPLLWPLALLAALAGFGRLAQRLLRATPTLSTQFLEAPAWGLAAISLLGSIANLFSLAGRTPLLIATILGILLLLLDIPLSLRTSRSLPTAAPRRPASRDPLFLLLTAIVTLLIILRFTSSLFATFSTAPGFQDIVLNPHDDMHSYLVSAERLLQTGTLGHDPFNSRLMMSSLGTQHLLNAALLILLPEDRLHVVDSGMGLIALCLAAAALARRAKLSRALAAALILVPLSLQFFYVNISATITAAAALTVLVSAAIEESPPTPRALLLWSLRLGFLLASACALKGTMLFPACFFAFALILLRTLLERRPAFLLAGAGALAAAILCLLPWMLWQYQNAGTPLYPILGKGFHATAFGILPFPNLDYLPEPAAHFLRTGIIAPAILLAIILLILILPRTRRLIPRPLAAAAPAIVAAWLLTWPVLAYSTQMIDLPRYITPTTCVGLAAAIAFLCAFALSWQQSHPRSPLRSLPAAAFALLLLCTAADWSKVYFIILPSDFSRGLVGPHPTRGQNDALVTQIRNLQSAVPPGQPLLVYLAQPAFLNFTRNPIYVIDWPGETSPPPGMPVYSGPDAVRNYLLAHHLRYLAYAYRTKANFPPDQRYLPYLQPRYGNIIRRQTAGAFAFQQDLATLEKTSRTLYNDGTNELLDLASPATHPTTSSPNFP